MKNLILLTTLLFSTVLQAADLTVKADAITTNNPAKTVIDVKKNVDIQSTGGIYLPSGTTAQQPVPYKDGMLRYNSTLGTAEIYSGGVWGEVGGSTTILDWVPSTNYEAGDFVIESLKLYRALLNHTSGLSFNPDLVAGDWEEISPTVMPNLTGDVTSVGTVTTYNGIVPIAKGGTGSATQNFVDLTTTQSVGGAKTFTSNVTATDYGFNNVKYGGTLVGKSLAELNSTGLLSGAVTAINANPALFNFGAGSGEVIDYATDPANPTIKPVSWSAYTAVSVTNIATADKTYILVNSDGTLHQQITFPTQAERRAKIFAAVVVHPNHSTIQNITTLPDFTQGIGSQVYDFLDALGAFNVSGNAISANGANLSLNKTAGQIFRRSTNYANDDQNPHVTTQAAATPKSFVKATFNAQIGGSVTVIDPANYDVAGTVTAVPGGGAVSTIQRIYMFSSGLMFVQYGQTTYTNLANALAGIQNESFVVNPSIADGGVLLAYIAVQKNCTALNASCARILPAARFDAGAFGGAISVTTLQGAYNNSTAPQIITDSTRGAVEIQRGSAADTDSVLKIQNGAGLAVIDAKGNGEIKVENKITSDTVARDNNLLVNPSFEYATFNQGWTCSLGTATVEAASVTDGVKALGVVSIGAGVRCYQTSTTNVAGLKGTLLQARARVKTTDTIMKVCGLVDGNGAANERNCVDVSPTTTDNVFYSAQTQPFQAGGTSNGIVIYTTTTTTQPTVIDAAHVGVVNGALASFSNNTGWVPFTATSPNGSFTISTNECFKRRNGPDLMVRCKLTNSATAGTEARIAIPDGLTSAGTNLIPSLTMIGKMAQGGFAATYFNESVLIEPNVTYMTFGRQDSAQSEASKSIASSIVGPGTALTFFASIPIAGWEANTNAAIAGCVNAFGCTNEVSAKISSTCAVSGENVDFINGNGVLSATSTCTFTLNTGLGLTNGMSCTASANASFSTTGLIIQFPTSSTTTIVTETRNDAGAASAQPYFLSCQKSGTDFKPKTVVVSPLTEYSKTTGGGNTRIISGRFGSGAGCMTACTAGTCTLCLQNGTDYSTVTFVGAGSYRINGIDGTKYACSGAGYSSTGPTVLYSANTSQNASYASVETINASSVNVNSFSVSFLCHGSNL